MKMMKLHGVAFTIIFMVLISESEGIFPQKKTVKISNFLETNDDLSFHCKSGDDLGNHTLQYGKSYQFSFKTKFIVKNTRFHCSFKWKNSNGDRWFDIYTDKRDEGKCDFCQWDVFTTGPCRYNRLKSDCFPWI
ncbi:hypothetical protein M5689_000283 [Euphorbia peplus]|nr:hypothetical protein M5689_000283 [Euphorbia peplus]